MKLVFRQVQPGVGRKCCICKVPFKDNEDYLEFVLSFSHFEFCEPCLKKELEEAVLALKVKAFK